LKEITPNNASERQHIIFDPIPRVDGIEASADPLFEPRANIYLMARRRPKPDQRIFVGVITPVAPHIETPEEVRDCSFEPGKNCRQVLGRRLIFN